MWDRHWSEPVAKHAVWLSGLVEFEEAESILEKIGQIVILDSSVWRRVETRGERGKAAEAVQRATATALPPRSEIVTGEACQPKEMGVAMDGAMVPIRAEGYKELKVGCVFDLEVRPTRDQQTGDLIDLAHAVHNSYVAHPGGPEVFGQSVWSEARRRDWTRARETIALGDGAPWIWNRVREHFYDSRQAVDGYHASAHWMAAAHRLKGEGAPAAHRWFKDHETILFEGHADRIAARLRRAAPAHTMPAPGAYHARTRGTRTWPTTCAAKPATLTTIIAGCSIWNFAKTVFPSAAEWSRVAANSFGHASMAPACAGADPGLSACFPCGRQS